MSNSIRLVLISGAVASMALIAAPGCSDDEESTPGGTSGTAGSSGASGSSGRGGSGGSAGSAGSSGRGGSGGSSGTTGTGGTSGTGGTTGTGGTAGTAGTGGTGGTTGDGGVTDAGPDTGDDAGPAACATYCTGIQATCTGSNEQYANPGACNSACQQMTPGTTGATSGDTLACRITHLGFANNYDAGSGERTTHCGHAGPTGGGQCD